MEIIDKVNKPFQFDRKHDAVCHLCTCQVNQELDQCIVLRSVFP
jgi:hypothetical protein